MPHKDPEKYRAYQTAYRKGNPERLKGYYRKYADKLRAEGRSRRSPTYYRKQNLRKYGLSVEDYIRLLEQQHGVCAICSQPEPQIVNEKRRNLVVDHNHQTGKVRGLLCTTCNVGLGMMQEDPVRLHSMIRYTEQHNEVD